MQTAAVLRAVLLALTLCLGRGDRARNADTVIRNADTNSDGDLGREEIKKVISTIGGKAFDDAQEIAWGANSVFRRLDADGDGLIETTEFADFWQRRGWLRTVDETADWLNHAVQLPQYEQSFRENAITGFDFPQLLENQATLLTTDVGVRSKLHLRQLVRAIRMVLFGVASVPRPVEKMQVKWPTDSDSCTASLEWATTTEVSVANRVVLSVHRFEVQMRTVPHKAGWEKMYSGPLSWHIHPSLTSGQTYEFRVRAWNLVGPSAWNQVSATAECPDQISPILRHLSTSVAILSATIAIIRVLSSRYALRQAGREARTRAAIRREDNEVKRSTAALEARLPAFHHPAPLLIPSKGESSSNEGTPMTPSTPPPELVRFAGLKQQSPGVYLYTAPPVEVGQQAPNPYTDADDEMVTLGEKFWESEEEETPPSSPKVRSTPRPPTGGSRCAICTKKFNVFKNRGKHQCRMCTLKTCGECTVVGCGVFGVFDCGDKCVCRDCEQKLRKSQRAQHSNQVKRESEIRLRESAAAKAASIKC